MSAELEGRIVGDRAYVQQRGRVLHEVSIEALVRAVADAAAPSSGFQPIGTRKWVPRGDALGFVIEVPSHVRTVSWLDEQSPRPYGEGAVYRDYRLAFPFVVLLVTCWRGEPCTNAQLYYRVSPLDEGDEQLLLPNLPNVAQTGPLRCWICLLGLERERDGGMSLARRIDRLTDHVFSGAFNRSSEEHEGNSRWSASRDLDPRLRSPESWEAATLHDARFILEVPWQKAHTTATAELEHMLDRIAPRRGIATASDLAALATLARTREPG